MFKLLNDVNILTPDTVNDDIAVILSEIILLHVKSIHHLRISPLYINIEIIIIMI